MLLEWPFPQGRLYLIRGLVIFLGCAIFCITSITLQQQRPAAYRIATNLSGESWYSVKLSADHVGYMYNDTFQDYRGRWHFVTTTHFQLQENAPNTIVKHLTFAARAPFPLEHAIYSNRSPGQRLTTEVVAHDGGYSAHLARQQHNNTVELDWQFDLQQFLEFEQWLATASPDKAAERTAVSPDFERLRISQRTYRIVERNELGYVVETDGLFAATRTQLDERFKPVQLLMAGIFEVTATNEADAISLKVLRRKTNYLFEVDQRLDDHTSLAGLHLRLHGANQLDLPQDFKLRHNPVTSNGNGEEHVGEELRFPITHPSIQTLVQESLAEDAAQNVAHLVASANEQLRYAENQPAGSVLSALADGRGECTDFADLLTTMARAAGYPARNIYGLAYKDGPRPAFMFHAWNEIYADGRWQAVDPTWNQTRVDATHIPLSERHAALMMLANNTGEVGFSVVSAEYF